MGIYPILHSCQHPRLPAWKEYGWEEDALHFPRKTNHEFLILSEGNRAIICFGDSDGFEEPRAYPTNAAFYLVLAHRGGLVRQPYNPWDLPTSSSKWVYMKRLFVNKKQLLVTIADLSPWVEAHNPAFLWKLIFVPYTMGFSGGSQVKNLPANAGDICSIPGLGRSPGEGNGNTLQHSCLEDPMDKGAWQASAHRITTSEMT